MINGGYKLVGLVHITVADADGTVISQRAYNTITNYMRSSIAQWLAGGNVQTPTQIGAGNGAIPSGQTGPLPTDTALWAPMAGTQRTCDSIQVTQGYYAQFNLTYQITDPAGTYTELGLFDVNGNMWAHVAINQAKSSSQTLTAQWMIYMVADPSNASATVTNTMRSSIAQWLAGLAPTQPTKIQLGTGTGTPAPTDTALWTAAAGTNKQCAAYVVNTYNVQYAVTYQSADPTGTFTEAALMDAAGNVWLHGKVSATKTAPNLLSITAQIGVGGN